MIFKVHFDILNVITNLALRLTTMVEKQTKKNLI